MICKCARGSIQFNKQHKSLMCHFIPWKLSTSLCPSPYLTLSINKPLTSSWLANILAVRLLQSFTVVVVGLGLFVGICWQYEKLKHHQPHHLNEIMVSSGILDYSHGASFWSREKKVPETKALLNLEMPRSHFVLQLLNEEKHVCSRNVHHVSVNLSAENLLNIARF